MAMKKPKGWVKEPVRHGLASKGIPTSSIDTRLTSLAGRKNLGLDARYVAQDAIDAVKKGRYAEAAKILEDEFYDFPERYQPDLDKLIGELRDESMRDMADYVRKMRMEAQL